VRSGIVLAIVLVVGLGVIIGVSAAVAGQDNTGQTVSAQGWADDVCGTIGAWEGQLEAIRDELDQSNYAARRNDGGSGDSVERTLVVRAAIDRAIQATNDTLREGLKRAGSPEGVGGQAAALALRAWALKTEHDLRVAKAILNRNPGSTTAAYEALTAATRALQQSLVTGRAVLVRAAGAEGLADAFSGSDNCQALREEQS
jgi:hypothetical protein